ncbi:MAG: hypothetical protein DMF59_02295 [Acidobacteria bacterium]|nr:MAG: hypothetical protein DMF59_02295 [Acidobacteriota bacterium]
MVIPVIGITSARQHAARIDRLFCMKRTMTAVLLALSLSTAACTTAVVARPPRPGMVLVEGVWVVPPRIGAVWIPAHYERVGFHRVWIAGRWRY